MPQRLWYILMVLMCVCVVLCACAPPAVWGWCTAAPPSPAPTPPASSFSCPPSVPAFGLWVNLLEASWELCSQPRPAHRRALSDRRARFSSPWPQVRFLPAETAQGWVWHKEPSSEGPSWSLGPWPPPCPSPDQGWTFPHLELHLYLRRTNIGEIYRWRELEVSSQLVLLCSCSMAAFSCSGMPIPGMEAMLLGSTSSGKTETGHSAERKLKHKSLSEVCLLQLTVLHTVLWHPWKQVQVVPVPHLVSGPVSSPEFTEEEHTGVHTSEHK